MKRQYITRCSNEQIKQLMNCYADYTDIIITRRTDCVDVELTVDGLPETYTMHDYDVDVYDWDDTNTDYLLRYRKKMLKFFGNQYAIDYLLG